MNTKDHALNRIRLARTLLARAEAIISGADPRPHLVDDAIRRADRALDAMLGETKLGTVMWVDAINRLEKAAEMAREGGCSMDELVAAAAHVAWARRRLDALLRSAGHGDPA